MLVYTCKELSNFALKSAIQISVLLLLLLISLNGNYTLTETYGALRKIREQRKMTHSAHKPEWERGNTNKVTEVSEALSAAPLQTGGGVCYETAFFPLCELPRARGARAAALTLALTSDRKGAARQLVSGAHKPIQTVVKKARGSSQSSTLLLRRHTLGLNGDSARA